MKVSIVTEGGINIGFGHISRSTALQQAFQEKGVSCELVINADDKVESILSESDYRTFDWLSEPEKMLNSLRDVDLVIIDSYLAGLEFYQKVASTVPRAVYIDDYQRLDYPKGTVLNGTVYAKELNYPQKEGLAYLLGSEYVFLRKEFWNFEDKAIKRDIKDVLITFGGRDSSGLIQKISNRLKSEFNFNFQLVDKNSRVDSKKFIDLMLESDLCVSAGGQTTYELARCGTPTIGVCVADNQLLNLKAWEKTGFLEFVGWDNNEDLLEKIAKSVTRFSAYDQRVKSSNIGKKYVDGQGARRVVGEILSYAKN